MRENSGGFFAKLILKSLSFSLNRTLIIFFAISLGSAVTAAFVNVYLDIDSKMHKELKVYGANFIVSSANPSDKPYITYKTYEEALSGIEAKNLLGSSPYLYGMARLGLGNAVIAGVDFAQMRRTKPFMEVREGGYINVDFDSRNALVGMDLAKKMELKVGSEVGIAGEDGIVVKVKIKGIVFTGGEEDNILFISLPLAQNILKKDGLINFVEFVILGNFDELNALGERLSDDTLSAKAVARISQNEGVILDKIKLLMALVAFTVLIITSMCVNTTLSSIVFSRVKEIALLRAIGASKNSVAALFGIETFTIALISSLIGALVGFLLAQALGQAIFGSGVDFRFLSVPIAVFISLVFAAIAAFYPIKKSLNIKVAYILQGE